MAGLIHLGVSLFSHPCLPCWPSLAQPWLPRVGPHLVFEYLAFFVGFRYYLILRKKHIDPISRGNRLSILVGAVFGALLGSRLVGFLEDPQLHASLGWVHVLNNKSIMGGLFGGLLGVEAVKIAIGERHSSGDLFTLPLIVGIAIGRIGCFLAGTDEFTYGSVTHSFLGLDLGDGLPRHPIALYEIAFLLLLLAFLGKRWKSTRRAEPGDLFKMFMLAYFGFRFLIEFLKPNSFLIFGLSSIQYLSIICYVYYSHFIRRHLSLARQRSHIL